MWISYSKFFMWGFLVSAKWHFAQKGLLNHFITPKNCTKINKIYLYIMYILHKNHLYTMCIMHKNPICVVYKMRQIYNASNIAMRHKEDASLTA